ncbi:MAG: acyl-ACP--UDP-N-acetylglucosamine O-acyltransferase [Deltaproteobacteria bacterium]|nr:acyl-ACP--UDP-N-acetylglucosamine O-acyltransferase [Deltaproteobacteria bacterium]
MTPENYKDDDSIKIDPTAMLHPSVELDSGVVIGPYSIIGEKVKIGKNTRVAPHVVVGRLTTIGSGCRLFQFSSVGAEPQDLGYDGEDTEAIIGDNNIIREFVTIHRGTAKDAGKTIVGSNNLFMNYTHVAHDCIVGDNVVMANCATLAGHVEINDHAIIGGLSAIHQFTRIGAYVIIGGGSIVTQDIIPFVMAVGNRATMRGLNLIGLRRAGFARSDISEIKKAYTLLFRSSKNLKDATEELLKEAGESENIKKITEFIKNSKRGVIRDKGKKGNEED